MTKDKSFVFENAMKELETIVSTLESESESLEKSMELMKTSNPLVIPRNHKVEEVLKSANEDNLEPLNKFLEILKLTTISFLS